MFTSGFRALTKIMLRVTSGKEVMVNLIFCSFTQNLQSSMTFLTADMEGTEW